MAVGPGQRRGHGRRGPRRQGGAERAHAHAGWGAGQLEEEMALNGWMNVPLSSAEMSNIIFDTPYTERYQRAIQNLGFDLSSLSGEAGHA